MKIIATLAIVALLSVSAFAACPQNFVGYLDLVGVSITDPSSVHMDADARSALVACYANGCVVSQQFLCDSNWIEMGSFSVNLYQARSSTTDLEAQIRDFARRHNVPFYEGEMPAKYNKMSLEVNELPEKMTVNGQTAVIQVNNVTNNGISNAPRSAFVCGYGSSYDIDQISIEYKPTGVVTDYPARNPTYCGWGGCAQFEEYECNPGEWGRFA